MAGGEHNASCTLKPPHFVIQSDWNEAFAAENSELVWLHLSQKGEPTQYLKLSVDDKKMGPDGKYTAVQCTDSTIAGYLMSQRLLKLTEWVGGNTPPMTCYFQAASDILDDLHKCSIYTLDINNEGLGVSSSSDGQMLYWHVSRREFRKPLLGHVADVYVCKFFPSGLTLLSGGADMMLKVWLLETGECVQTIKGHTAAITDVGMIERGRNFLACSKDGTCRLWDCGSAKCITEFGRSGSTAYINTMCVRSEGNFDTSIKPCPDILEYGTSNKIVTLGYENGHLRNYALLNREMTFQLKFDSAVNTVIDVNANLLVCGTDKGQLITCDVRQANYPLCISEEDRGAVLNVAKFQNGYFASFGDGTVCYKRADPVQNRLCPILELTGPNLDPVYRIVCKDDVVFTCSRDAKVRKYQLTSLSAKGVFI